jgi:RimJ/RimL family protein N-acetyltransferase
LKFARQWEAIREWEVGWAIHPDEWGKGYATEAARQVMDWGFRELDIHRIVAFCHASNSASVRVMEKLGMHQDGMLRETRWLRGEWWDEYVYAILEKDWKGKKDLPGI